jgi:hypothetical protein
MRYFHFFSPYGQEDYENATGVETPFDERHGLSNLDIRRGLNLVPTWPERFPFYYDSNTEDGDDFIASQPNNLGWPLFSTPLRSAIERLQQKNLQFLPTLITDKATGKQREDYWVLNLYPLVSGAFNFEETVYVGDERPEKNRIRIEPARFYAVNRSVIKDYHICRLQECLCAKIVSEKFKDMIEQEGFKGFAFRRAIVVEDT